MESETIFQDKMNRIQRVINNQIPDRVPIIPNIETWVYSYADVNLKEALTANASLAVNAFRKFNEEIYVDALLGNSNIIPFEMMNLFGEGLYTISEKGLQIKGSHGMTMQPEDYPELIENPERFFANEIIRRKYPILNQGSAENRKLFEQAFDRLKSFGAYNAEINRRIETELGLPLLTKGSFYVTPDIILDYLRDFVGVSTDLRRYPEQFYQACESIYKFSCQMLSESYTTPQDGHLVFSPLHLPTFLKPKDFEKFYFPFFKKYIQEICVDKGYTCLCFMENNWEPYLDILQDLPDGGKMIGLFEHGDLGLYKKKLSKKMTIMGGMPINLLAYGTKQQCLDKAKACLDLYAPGGNYIFSVDMVLMALQDAKPENVAATFRYVQENGKY